MSQPIRKQKPKPRKKVIGGVDFSKDYICLTCGCQRTPINVRRGHVAIETLLWLCYIVPGVVYTLWRTLRRHDVCPKCRNPSIVKTTSPQAFQLQRLMKTLSQPKDKTTGEA
ncbi:hypothetical protein [Nitrospina watsonii]|uniref:LITAF domain-containing protein n=1 Tax=Nitrospina watsonii TaxID=1323948 RepID=A0ABM9HEM8_9BACT|nr:hypothetical protein [Nitrospina watsonii]CAI2718679.1 conserved protein of unknown function [Nitrospina watsonii]